MIPALRTLIVLASLCSVGAQAQNTVVAPLPAPVAPRTAPATRYYAVTLTTGFQAMDISEATREFPQQTVYVTQSKVLGRTMFFARLGFFASYTEADRAKGDLLVRYPGAWTTAVTEEEHDTVLQIKPSPSAVAVVAPTPTPTPPPPAAAPLYAIILTASDHADLKPVGPMPPALAEQQLYLYKAMRAGKPLYQLRLGFFANEAASSAARQLVLVDYPKATVAKVPATERTAAVSMAIRGGGETPPAPTALPTPAQDTTAIDKLAEPLMLAGRDALLSGKNALAIRTFDRLLNLPPNKYSQEAQEYIGLARERSGETKKAKIEYELYLKLYPEGDGAERVRQRLANIDHPVTPALVHKEPKATATRTLTYGTLSQFFYHGSSHIDTTTVVPSGVETATLTSTDQSALVNTLDLTTRIRSQDYDNRVVLRDTYTLNFLEGQENLNRLNAAYLEIKNRKYDYGLRLGRQPGSTNGVLGKFDGLSASYRVHPKWRLIGVAGVPADLAIDTNVSFYGLALELGTFQEHWTGSSYYIMQQADGITDRQAVGGDLRYFDPSQTYYGLVDYDTSYHELNTLMLQANWLTRGNTNFNVLIDHRKSPTLQTTNALIGESITSIRQQLETLSEEQLRQQAVDRTPVTNLYMAGFATPLNKTWQIGGDIRMYNISGTPASGTAPASPGTGNVLIYAAQLIGTGLVVQRDISVLSYSYLDSDTYSANSWSFTNRSVFHVSWTIDPSLRFYDQVDSNGTHTSRFTPTLHVAYRIKENISLEIEGSVEKTKTDSTGTQDITRRSFYSLGYRWDF